MTVGYDPYTDKFIDDGEKESITATINLDAFPKNIIQLNVVNVSDDSINKIADAVLQKLRAEQTEPQTDDPCKGCVNDNDDNILACVACVLKENLTDCSWK